MSCAGRFIRHGEDQSKMGGPSPPPPNEKMVVGFQVFGCGEILKQIRGKKGDLVSFPVLTVVKKILQRETVKTFCKL